MKILKLNIQQIVQQVKDGTLSVEEVKQAYLTRALDVAVESNYLAEICQEVPLNQGKD